MAVSKLATPLVFYACQSGKETLDHSESGGNSFASALIELLERPSLTYAELSTGILVLTKEKSYGYQLPEVPTATHSTQWVLKPSPGSARRVALVFMFSDYRDSGGTSLPGAERDLERVSMCKRFVTQRAEFALLATAFNLKMLWRQWTALRRPTLGRCYT